MLPDLDALFVLQCYKYLPARSGCALLPAAIYLSPHLKSAGDSQGIFLSAAPPRAVFNQRGTQLSSTLQTARLDAHQHCSRRVLCGALSACHKTCVTKPSPAAHSHTAPVELLNAATAIYIYYLAWYFSYIIFLTCKKSHVILEEQPVPSPCSSESGLISALQPLSWSSSPCRAICCTPLLACSPPTSTEMAALPALHHTQQSALQSPFQPECSVLPAPGQLSPCS